MNRSENKVIQFGGIKKFLTFSLGDEEYAIDILKIKEIKSVQNSMEITKMIDVPPAVRGIIKMHNVIIPVIDLRILCHTKQEQEGDIHVIIVVYVEDQALGLVVDSAREILELSSDQIKPVPDFCEKMDKNCMEGVVSLSDRLIILLDIEKLISIEDLQIRNLDKIKEVFSASS